jgi:hypothetical protein
MTMTVLRTGGEDEVQLLMLLEVAQHHLKVDHDKDRYYKP